MFEPAPHTHPTSHNAVWLTRGQLALVFSLAVALLLAVAGDAYQESRREAQARRMGVHSLLAMKQTLELDIAALVMEANQRGYLISGEGWMLARRQASYRQAVQLIGELSTLVADNPAQVQRLRQALVELNRRYAWMQQRSALAASAGLAAARVGFQPSGINSIEPLRKTLKAVVVEEQRLLVAREQATESALDRFRLLLLASTALALAILVAAGLALRRELTRAERISAALGEVNGQQADLNRELNSQAEQLTQSNRELESFSYSISHDLRAPLRHIDGYAQMLLEDAGDSLQPESQRYLRTIIDSARRMGLLIDDLLAFSRLGRKPLSRLQVNMQDLVESTVIEIRQGKAASNEQARIEVAALPPVEGDPALLRQVWANLLSNAIKYSAPRGKQACIVVAGEKNGDQVHYSVRDNGVGFDMRYADKLFGVFQRLHAQDEFEGTGVGLAIVQRIINRHGGQVSATAEVGKGACFSFQLPINEALP